MMYFFPRHSCIISCSLTTSLFIIYVIVCIFTSSQAAEQILNSDRSTIPAIFTFGDSVVDTGNNNNLVLTIVKSNFPPYGKDFTGGVPTGRFCNGKVSSDFIVEELGIKELLPAYLDPNLKDNDLLTGVNFASSGAGFDPLTSSLMQVISLSDQLRLFEDYKTKLKMLVGEERANTTVANSLYIVAAGTNDITNTYFNTLLLFRRLQYNVSSYTDFMVNYASIFLQKLYLLGARRIAVIGVSPVGCVPSQRTLYGGIERHCSEEINQATQMFNAKLLSKLNSLNNNLSQVKMAYVDGYNFMFDIIQNPKKYGFEVVDRGCCGTGLLEVGFMCIISNIFECKNVSRYVFWDGFHPSERTYQLLVHHLVKKMVNDVI